MQGYTLLSHIRIASYLLCVTYWIVTLAQKAPVSKGFTPQMEREMIELQRRVAYQLSHVKSWGRSS
jgi:hypothetical protein